MAASSLAGKERASFHHSFFLSSVTFFEIKKYIKRVLSRRMTRSIAANSPPVRLELRVDNAEASSVLKKEGLAFLLL